MRHGAHQGLGRMRDHRLNEIRTLVARGQYQLSEHVFAAIELGEFDERDIETCIMTGVIRQREKDELGVAADRYKYAILGHSCCGAPFEVVGKFISVGANKEVFIITAYHREGYK